MKKISLVTSIQKLRVGDVIGISTQFVNCLDELFEPDDYRIENLDCMSTLSADLRHESGEDLSPVWMDLNELISLGQVYTSA